MQAQQQPKISQFSSIKSNQNIEFNNNEEELVGIQQYISKGGQIPAITKYLISDFIVNQISTNGQVVVLKDKPLSKKIQDTSNKKPNYQMTKQLYELIQSNLSKQAAKQVEKLYERLDSGQKIDWEFVLQDIPKSKQDRTKLHNFVRQKLQNIQSNTLDGGKIKLRFNKKLIKIDPASRHKYIHFKLFKSGIDTMSALFKLSKITGISQKVFSTAGLKDKRGITTQMVSTFNSDIKRLKNFYNVANRNKEIWIDQFQQIKDNDIGMGDLFGNQFGLVIRLIKSEDGQKIKQRVESLRNYGMINYFGMQRFGTCATKTHMIGAMIVKKMWKQIVQKLVLQDTGNFGVNDIKKQLFQNKEYSKAERLLSNKYKIEKYLFKGLQKYGLNYPNVFQSLPRSMKTLYCHALQSFIWNKAVSRRIRDYGLQLVEGDLVGISSKTNITEHQKKQQNVQNKEQLEVDELIIQQEEVAEQDEQMEIVLINKDNIQKFNIFDLVAPLYGQNSKIPQKSHMHRYVQEELQNLELRAQNFEQNSKVLHFRGTYRKCIIKPANVSCELLHHKQKKAQLQSAFYIQGEKSEFQKGDLLSAHVVLQLPKSAYATIAIREILHIPSSFGVQSQLNRIYGQL